MRIRYARQVFLILLPACFLAADPAKLAEPAASPPGETSLSPVVKASAVAAQSGLTIDVAISGPAPELSSAAYNEACAGDAVEIQLSAARSIPGGAPAVLRLVTDKQGVARMEGVLPIRAQCGKLKALRLPYTWEAAGVTAAVSGSPRYTARLRVPAPVLAWLLPQSPSVAVTVRFLSAETRTACAIHMPPADPAGASLETVQQFTVELHQLQEETATSPPLLKAATAYIEQGPREAAAILEREPQDVTLLPVLAVMRELAGERQSSLQALQTFAAQPLLPAAAREWAQFEWARILANSDPAAVLKVLEELGSAASPSSAARAQALIAQLKGEDMISRLLALVAPQCGDLSSSDTDRQAFAGCVIRGRSLANAQKIPVIAHLQRLLTRNGQYLIAFRAGTEALRSPALQPFGTSLIPATAQSLSLARRQSEDAKTLAPEFIEAASYDADSFLSVLRELEVRGFREEADEAIARLISSPEIPARLRSFAFLAQLQSAVRTHDAALAVSAGQRLIETSPADRVVRRTAVRLLAQLQTSLPPADPDVGAVPLIQDALGGVETGCSTF